MDLTELVTLRNKLKLSDGTLNFNFSNFSICIAEASTSGLIYFFCFNLYLWIGIYYGCNSFQAGYVFY